LKSNLLFFLISLTALISCSEDDTIYSNIEGYYVGTFQRGENTSNVELLLTNNEFSGGVTGTEGFYKFPAICRGTYSVKSKEIVFSNTCFWTAEFDWTLILTGNWIFTFKNNTLTLKNSIGDIYRLKKQD
jgi:hypothetical protein